MRSKVPLICAHPSSISSFSIFNPNEWSGDSKAIVQSCSTEYSVLNYGVERIADLCRFPKQRCQPHFENLAHQWNSAPWDLGEVVCYAQDPELHLTIEGFFSGVKSLLDLIVQLLATQRIVTNKLHGFHSDGDIYGGKVLNSLQKNVCADKRKIAENIKELIAQHKGLWIDEIIFGRDRLIHPGKGAHQLMFKIVLENCEGSLVFNDAVPPHIGHKTIDTYSALTLNHMKQFASSFMRNLQATKATG